MLSPDTEDRSETTEPSDDDLGWTRGAGAERKFRRVSSRLSSDCLTDLGFGTAARPLATAPDVGIGGPDVGGCGNTAAADEAGGMGAARDDDSTTSPVPDAAAEIAACSCARYPVAATAIADCSTPDACAATRASTLDTTSAGRPPLAAGDPCSCQAKKTANMADTLPPESASRSSVPFDSPPD